MGDDNAAPGQGPASCGPATLNEVLCAEISKLRPSLLAGLKPSTFNDTPQQREGNLRDIYRRIDSLWNVAPAQRTDAGPLAALCLSGGGIRSATFNLGVLQYLAKIGLLGKFDYLSSVSGGGYIAAWLRAWMHREGVDKVVEALGRFDSKRSPLAPEPSPVAKLREYSNYLTPQLGLFSGDTWAAVATVVRNLLLNWLVLIPLLAAVLGLPLWFMLVARTGGIPESWHRKLLIAAVGIELIASVSVYASRRFKKRPGTPRAYFIFACVLPICVAAGALATAGLGLNFPWRDSSPHPCCTDLTDLWKFCALWCIGIPIVGWTVAEISARLFPSQTGTATDPQPGAAEGNVKPRSAAARQVAPGYELAALLVSGAVGMALLVAIVRSWFSYLYNHPALYVILALPLLLGVYLLSRVLFVVIASLSETTKHRAKRGSSDDADREWWARLSGWVLLVMAVWTSITGICLLGSYIPHALGMLFPKDGAPGPALVTVGKWLVGALGAISGLAAALTGSSAKTPAVGNVQTNRAPPAAKRLLAFAGPLFVVCVVIVLSWGTKALGEWITQQAGLFSFQNDWRRESPPVPWTVSLQFLAVLLGLGLLAIGAGRLVNVNRFSLHGMYRNRLVRAYLGASNSLEGAGRERKPDPFTGFALDDNLALHALCSPAGTQQGNSVPAASATTSSKSAAAVRPLSIINTTLNLVHGENLAWQQRKAESFSMTPLYCGNWCEGYRRSAQYGGRDGISVGTAITISGAAVNPNMGYSSSPALGFLMAIFNVRLGAWLGNTNPHGNDTYPYTGPRQAIMPLFADIFGLTNSNRRYVNLSDGGHFDNLGLYEAVLRRCRHVLVSDAGQDRSFAFEDLGNAIRKIRIDFGVNITFSDKIEIPPSKHDKKGLYCALATIRYSEVDATSSEQDGILIYIKPTLHDRDGRLPYDIYSYARSSDDFPHESTLDQWFSESQFESYRALGFHILEQIAGEQPVTGFKEFHTGIGRHIDNPSQPTSLTRQPGEQK